MREEAGGGLGGRGVGCVNVLRECQLVYLHNGNMIFTITKKNIYNMMLSIDTYQ